MPQDPQPTLRPVNQLALDVWKQHFLDDQSSGADDEILHDGVFGDDDVVMDDGGDGLADPCDPLQEQSHREPGPDGLVEASMRAFSRIGSHNFSLLYKQPVKTFRESKLSAIFVIFDQSAPRLKFVQRCSRQRGLPVVHRIPDKNQ